MMGIGAAFLWEGEGATVILLLPCCWKDVWFQLF